VSHALPKGLQAFDQIDGVWVTEPRCAVALAIALRESLNYDVLTIRVSVAKPQTESNRWT
jgi:hypothetical protein